MNSLNVSPHGDVNCTIFGTFTTLYSAAWVFSYTFWLLPLLTGFRMLYGDGFHKDFDEKRYNWLGGVPLFTDNLQGLQLAALVEMRPPSPPPGSYLPADRLLCEPDQPCYFHSYTCTINLVTEPHCFQKNQCASHL